MVNPLRLRKIRTVVGKKKIKKLKKNYYNEQ